MLGKTMGQSDVLTERFRGESARLAELELAPAHGGPLGHVLDPDDVRSHARAHLRRRRAMRWPAAGRTCPSARSWRSRRMQTRLFFPVGSLLGVQADVQSSLALFDRIFEYLDLPVDIQRAGGRHRSSARTRARRGAPGAASRSRTSPSARCSRTSSFTAEPGSKVAIVGETGSGKTTLGYLIARLYDVSERRGAARRHRRARPQLRGAPAHRRRRLAGHLPVPRQRAREPALRAARRDRRAARAGGDAPRASTTTSPRSPTATTRSWASAATASRAARSSGSRSPARSCATRRCSYWTRPRARSTSRPSGSCSRRSTASPWAARRSSSRTASPRSATPT